MPLILKNAGSYSIRVEDERGARYVTVQRGEDIEGLVDERTLAKLEALKGTNPFGEEHGEVLIFERVKAVPEGGPNYRVGSVAMEPKRVETAVDASEAAAAAEAAMEAIAAEAAGLAGEEDDEPVTPAEPEATPEPAPTEEPKVEEPKVEEPKVEEPKAKDEKPKTPARRGRPPKNK